MDQPIKITAEPQIEPNKCKFILENSISEDYSFYFNDKTKAESSPLAKGIFEVNHVASVFLAGNEIIVEMLISPDWREVARNIGTKIREAIENHKNLVDQKLINEIPSKDEISSKINEVLEKEINPQVAGHGGYIKLLEVKGNNVFVEMGGGCQGCASSQATLKQGVQMAFRKAIPQIGAIYDVTDHAAGKNPYFTG